MRIWRLNKEQVSWNEQVSWDEQVRKNEQVRNRTSQEEGLAPARPIQAAAGASPSS